MLGTEYKKKILTDKTDLMDPKTYEKENNKQDEKVKWIEGYITMYVKREK